MSHKRPRGFTLIEVLIVVVIMAILAATIIPQMSSSTTDAKEALIRDHLRSLRTQLDVYKTQHLGQGPVGADGIVNLAALTKATDVSGNVSPTGLVDATYTLGPYLQGGIPVQPFSGNNSVRLEFGTTGLPVAIPAPGNGWIYRLATGEIFVDHASYVSW
jgi:general secretion pathway protein G